jgi:hypothetical protein
VAATSSLQLRAISNFGTPSATATINCEFKIIIEIEIAILSVPTRIWLAPIGEAFRQVFIPFLFKLGGFRLCENRQGGCFSA